MRDDLKTIWDEEHDFEEETESEGAPEAAPAPEVTPEVQKTPEQLKAEEAKARELAEKNRATQARGQLAAEVDAQAAQATADKSLNVAPVEPLDPKEVLNTAFAKILQDPEKIAALQKTVDEVGKELGADYATLIPAPTDDFFKKSQNALLYNLLYLARYKVSGKKPNEALAADESLTSDANMDKAIALLKEKSEASEIKEDLQKIDLEEVRKTLRLPAGTPAPETVEPAKEKAGWFQDFFGQAAHGIALDLIRNVNEEKAGVNDWMNLGGIQNKLLLMVLQLCTSLGGKEWYKELSEEDQTILEKRYGLIRKEDGSLFEFGKPTDPDYGKKAETPVETPAAPAPSPAPGTETSQIK